MAILLNRKYGSRLECLYYILQSRYSKFGTTQPFRLGDLKFDDTDVHNVHHQCRLLINCVGQSCCPFLLNPLNASKCYATQSVDSDSTKSKAVSDIGGSLEALGFIAKSSAKQYRITAAGERWAQTPFDTPEWEEIARQGVLSYGVTVGFLSKLRRLPDTFSYTGIYLGYPKTEERVTYTAAGGITRNINLSTDSQRDSNTRTMSRIIGWCVSTGLLIPETTEGVDPTATLAHMKYRAFVNREELKVRQFTKTDRLKRFFDTAPYVANPLSYRRLHKNVGSQRENGGEDLRIETLRYLPRILNRRYVLVKALNACSVKHKRLDLTELVTVMKHTEQMFFTPGNDANTVMFSEAEIADIAGIPFDIDENSLLVPLTTVNGTVLDYEVPREVAVLTDDILQELGL